MPPVWTIGGAVIDRKEFEREFVSIFKPRKHGAKLTIYSNVFGRITAPSLAALIERYEKRVGEKA
ncbi:MAG: hypothetical protein JWR80_10068 [Bradyrhizobium sp.]|nr:hypothetical protein [Bradyrhizobium sp.]